MSSSKESPATPEAAAPAADKLRDLEVKDASEVQGGKAAIHDFHFVKTVDKASPNL